MYVVREHIARYPCFAKKQLAELHERSRWYQAT